MKILVVVPSFEPSVGGGVASCFRSLCKGLSQVGVDVTVYSTNASRTSIPLDVPINRTITFGGIKIRYFPSTFGPKSLFDSRALTKEMQRTVQQYDLVYMSAIWQWIGISVIKICHKNEVPVVVGTHGSFAKPLRSKGKWEKNFFYKFALRSALKLTTATHVTSEIERREAGDWLEGHPIFVVPNAVDPIDYYRVSDTANRFRGRYGIPINAPVLITVGRPDWMKRIDLLIKAIAARPTWYLLVVGPNAEGKSPEWKRIADDLRVGDKVVWAGYLAGEELLAAYSASDLFALISRSENFGMVVIEALLCGLPVLVSPEVGVWGMLQDSDVGITVPMDTDAISYALDDYVMNPERWRNRANRARAITKSIFSPDQVAPLMKAAFEDILSGCHSSVGRGYDK